jgi:hypothetical protein
MAIEKCNIALGMEPGLENEQSPGQDTSEASNAGERIIPVLLKFGDDESSEGTLIRLRCVENEEEGPLSIACSAKWDPKMHTVSSQDIRLLQTFAALTWSTCSPSTVSVTFERAS